MMNAIYSLDTTVNWIGVSRKFVIAMVGAAIFALGAISDSIYHGTAYLPAIRAEAAKAPEAVAAAKCEKKRADKAYAALIQIDPAQAYTIPHCPPTPPVVNMKPILPLVR